MEQLKTKICKVCGEDKSLSEYTFHKTTGYYYRQCRKCFNKYMREYYKSVPEEQKQKWSDQKKVYHAGVGKAKSRVTVYKTIDRNKGQTNDLTVEWMEQVLKSSCHYCGFPVTGIDRKDNTQPHTIENSVPCCWECNCAKGDNFSEEEMLLIGKTIKKIKESRISSN